MKAKKKPNTSASNNALKNLGNLSNDSKKKKTEIKSKKDIQHKIEPLPAWPIYLRSANEREIQERYVNEVNNILSRYSDDLSNYCYLGIIDPGSGISSWELDQIYNALTLKNPNKDKDVFLTILSRGGGIDSAYQISKLCKFFSKKRFVVAIPRQAKSAATLLSIGADEIHMGLLSQLGPIDPQLGSLPALGVTEALKTIASLSERYPGCAEMFARYLRKALTVEQIGYCERISESAAQYAERLLLTKPFLSKNANVISHKLVHEYKDHGFVIDLDEAKRIFGDKFILVETPEIKVAEEIYNLFDTINFFLEFYREKRFLIIGSVDTGSFIFNKQN
jgi:hypothetical protein